jgi:hypothetical protein
LVAEGEDEEEDEEEEEEEEEDEEDEEGSLLYAKNVSSHPLGAAAPPPCCDVSPAHTHRRRLPTWWVNAKREVRGLYAPAPSMPIPIRGL